MRFWLLSISQHNANEEVINLAPDCLYKQNKVAFIENLSGMIVCYSKCTLNTERMARGKVSVHGQKSDSKHYLFWV